MGYGSKKTSDGKEVTGDNTFIIPVVGTKDAPGIDGCTFVGVELADDNGSATWTFQQPNGGTVKVFQYEAKGDLEGKKTYTKEQQIDDFNAWAKHIATKIVGQEAYAEFEDTLNERTTFGQFVRGYIRLLGTRMENMKFNMIFIYNRKGYVTLPKYANFIEVSGTTPTTLKLGKYDADNNMTRPQPDSETTSHDSSDEATTPVESDLPF